MKKLVMFVGVVLFASINLNENVKVLKSLDIEDGFLKNRLLKKSYAFYSAHKDKYFINSLENGVDIYPIIRNEIYRSSLPKELVSVVMAESLMKINAKSDKKAIGIWQFIPATARRYGLKIDEYVDERKDIYKSTKAAIKYLDYLHNLFGKWYLAIMAYNAGEARVVEAVVRAKVDKLCKDLGKLCKRDREIKKYRKIIRAYQRYGAKRFKDLYNLYLTLRPVNISLGELLAYQRGLKRQYLPRETRYYMLKILSLSFLFNNQKLREFSQRQLLKGMEKSTYVAITVPPGTSLFYISHILGMKYQTLRYHNYHLKYSFTPPYKYHIYIPTDKVDTFYANFDPHNRKYVYIYKVKKGDTLFKIAKKFNIDLKVLYSYNRIGKYLHTGDKLFIPLSSQFIKYRVRKGDTLSSIAKRFRVSYEKIMKINNISSSFIRVGEVLKIPQRF